MATLASPLISRPDRTALALALVTALAVGMGCGLRRGEAGESPAIVPSGSFEDRDPSVLESPAPEYPPALRAQGVEGFVVLDYGISPQGTVVDPRVVASQPDGTFDEAAIASVSRWTHEPRMIDGQPVEGAARVLVTFCLEKGGPAETRPKPCRSEQDLRETQVVFRAPFVK